MTLRLGGYVSPLLAEDRPNYAKRIEGTAVVERLHLWPTRDGDTVQCSPVYCRECERERTWKEGQTRGI